MSHTSSNGENSPNSNNKVERSSLSIHISNSNSKNTVKSNNEGSNPVFDRGKNESVETQDEGGSDIDRYERPPFERILNDDYTKINYGYDRRPKNSRKLKDVLRFLCTIVNDNVYKEGNTVYSFDIMNMTRDEINDRLKQRNLKD